MLKYYKGTVFNTPAKTLVNAVNCVGVMGAGIALEFKLRYPNMFQDYKKKCSNGEYNIGTLEIFEEGEITILNFPTKKHWRYPSKIEWIEEGLKYFVDNYKRLNIKSVAFPKLGSSNGGLKWEDVKEVMEKYLSDLEIEVYICLDELEEAEGIEKKMLDFIANATTEELMDKLHLRRSLIDTIKSASNVKRFWYIGKSEGISAKVYEKIFLYAYNNLR